MKKMPKKLQFKSDTIRRLGDSDLGHAHGGTGTCPINSAGASCASCLPATCIPASDHCGGGGGGGGIPSIEVCTIKEN